MSNCLVILHDADDNSEEGRQALRIRLEKRFDVSISLLEKAFKDLPIILKKNSSRHEAERYTKIVEELGGIVEILEENPVNASEQNTEQNNNSNTRLKMTEAMPNVDLSLNRAEDSQIGMTRESHNRDRSGLSSQTDLSLTELESLLDNVIEDAKGGRDEDWKLELKSEESLSSAKSSAKFKKKRADKEKGFGKEFEAYNDEPLIDPELDKPIIPQGILSVPDPDSSIFEMPQSAIIASSSVPDSVYISHLDQTTSIPPFNASDLASNKAFLMAKHPEAQELSSGISSSTNRPRVYSRQQQTSPISKTNALVLLASLLFLTIFIVDPLNTFNRAERINKLIPDIDEIQALIEQQALILGHKKDSGLNFSELLARQKSQYWIGSNVSNRVNAKVKIKSSVNKIKEISLQITSADPLDLSLQELASGGAEEAWIKRFDGSIITDKLGESNAPGMLSDIMQFDLRGRGKVYVEDKLGDSRQIATFVIQGSLDKKQNSINGTWRISRFEDQVPIGRTNFAKRLFQNKFSVFLAGSFTAPAKVRGNISASDTGESEIIEELQNKTP